MTPFKELVHFKMRENVLAMVTWSHNDIMKADSLTNYRLWFFSYFSKKRIIFFLDDTVLIFYTIIVLIWYIRTLKSRGNNPMVVFIIRLIICSFSLLISVIVLRSVNLFAFYSHQQQTTINHSFIFLFYFFIKNILLRKINLPYFSLL